MKKLLPGRQAEVRENSTEAPVPRTIDPCRTRSSPERRLTAGDIPPRGVAGRGRRTGGSRGAQFGWFWGGRWNEQENAGTKIGGILPQENPAFRFRPESDRLVQLQPAASRCSDPPDRATDHRRPERDLPPGWNIHSDVDEKGEVDHQCADSCPEQDVAPALRNFRREILRISSLTVGGSGSRRQPWIRWATTQRPNRAVSLRCATGSFYRLLRRSRCG